MFNSDFWPTPFNVVERMFDVVDPTGMIILEPSAGMGNIVIKAKERGANVIACEKDERLKLILENECDIIESDFFNVTSDRISHIHAIYMNPPFSNADNHILHAFNIAPEGCEIVALCNEQTIKNSYSGKRKELLDIIAQYGYHESWEDCFSQADRQTEVNVSMVYIRKPKTNSEGIDYSDFFLDEEPESDLGEGIMNYDAIRDIVNRYVAAVKLYEDQIKVGVKMRELINIFPTYNNNKGSEEKMKYISCNPEKVESYKSDFKKGLQKRAWKFIFDKLDLQKYSTKGLKEDINKFVEQRSNIPFTMKNIYKMLEIVIGTSSSRMDKALEEVFDKLTKHYDENRYHVEGWKTNSHYLVNQKFIINNMCSVGWSGEIDFKYYNNGELIEDLQKALCHMTAKRYEEMVTLHQRIRGTKYNPETKKDETIERPAWGTWFDWGFFECRCYKKGTMHFKFKDENIWHSFNKNVARIKGYPLFEGNSKRSGYKKTYSTI